MLVYQRVDISHPSYIQAAHGLIDPIPLGHLAVPSRPGGPSGPKERPPGESETTAASLEGGTLHGGGACFQVQTVHGHHLRDGTAVMNQWNLFSISSYHHMVSMYEG